MANDQPGRWPLPLGVSSTVVKGDSVGAILAALDASPVACLELVPRAPLWQVDDPAARSALVAQLRQARVRLHSVHLPFGRSLDISQTDDAARGAALDATMANLRTAAELGAPLAVVHPSAEPIADEKRAARMERSRQSLERLADVAAALGVRLAVECLPRTCLAHTADELLTLIADLDPETVGVCIDTNHLNLREPDIGAAIGQLAPRLLTLHISDNDGIDERHWLPGHENGVVDWPAVASALKAASYTGPFLYEVRSPAEDPAAAIAAVVANYADVIVPLFG